MVLTNLGSRVCAYDTHCTLFQRTKIVKLFEMKLKSDEIWCK